MGRWLPLSRGRMPRRRAQLTAPLIFFFNDTATTEIYTVRNTLPTRRSSDLARIDLLMVMRVYATARGGYARRVVSRSEEHTSELQSLRTISYAVFCLKKK